MNWQCPYHGGECELPRDIAKLNAQRAQVRQAARHTLRHAQGRTYEMATFTGESAATLTLERPPEPKPDYTRTPVRAPTVQSDVTVPMLQAAITGFIAFTGVSALAIALGAAAPLAWGCAGGFVSFALGWRGALGWTRDGVQKIEQFTGVDINRDGHLGEPQPDIISPIPVYAPGSRRPENNKPKIRLRPSTRLVDRDKLCDYLSWAFVNGWTRDKAQSFGIGQKEWPDVRDFVKQWQDYSGGEMWATDDGPALDEFIDSLRKR